MRHFLQLLRGPFLCSLLVSACGGSVETEPDGSTSASGAGASGSTTGATAAHSTGASMSGSTTASGAGGGACGASHIDVVVDNGAPVSWTALCSGAHGGTETTQADGYIFEGGPPPGVQNLVIDGCTASAPGAEGLELTARDALSPGHYLMGRSQYTDPNGVTWGIDGDGFDVTVTTLDPVGGSIDGSFSIFVSHGGNAAHSLAGTFHVCRVSDMLVP